MARDPERLARAFNPPAEHYDVRGTAAFALTMAHRGLRQHLWADRWELGLYEGRDLVLLEIARLVGRATPKEIQASLGMSRGSLSTVLGRSMSAGYVERERDPVDGRTWRLRLTSIGVGSALLGARMWRGADEALQTELTGSDVRWLRHLSQAARSAWLAAPDA